MMRVPTSVPALRDARREEPRANPRGFLDRLTSMGESGRLDDGVDLVLAILDEWAEGEKWEDIGDLLWMAAESALHLDIVVALLMATRPAARRLGDRADLLDRFERRLVAAVGREEAERTLFYLR